MSAPTTQTPQGQLVSAFVGQVRRHLDDLPSDDVEELVGGLEADLADSLAEAAAGGTDDPARLLGDPAVYAPELRAGAGTVGFPCFVKPVMSSSGSLRSLFSAAIAGAFHLVILPRKISAKVVPSSLSLPASMPFTLMTGTSPPTTVGNCIKPSLSTYVHRKPEQ